MSADELNKLYKLLEDLEYEIRRFGLNQQESLYEDIAGVCEDLLDAINSKLS